ncbi:MAG: AAA family ATPase [Bacteroidales bacterium]|nr:AAA family ATPase [Bacteroidales bacterium]
MKTRIQTILRQISEGVYEKDAELALSLLAALSGESVILLGPPGVAKSMVARRLKLAFAHARSFEYLMSRFSTPDEIFGPVSIQRLKSDDVYQRCVEGYLPTADVVFLDEIWKAGPAIQNTLLTVINEKVYLNGNQLMRLPLKLLIGASNELPVQGEGLEALWDRFLIRLVSQPIQNEESFYRMVDPAGVDECDMRPISEAITEDEYHQWLKAISSVKVPREVLLAITGIRDGLKDVAIEGQDVHRNIYVSDRRWKKIVHLMCASAFVHDRNEVNASDLQLAIHCLWNEPDELSSIGKLVADAIFRPYLVRLDTLQRQVSRALRGRTVRQMREKARLRGDHRDDDLIIFDGLYYQLVESQGLQNTFIYVPDFGMLPTRSSDEPAVRGVLFKDPIQPKRTIIRAYTNPDNVGEHEAELQRVNLYRDSMNLYVNGTRYPLRRAARGMQLQQSSGLEPPIQGACESLEECESAVDMLFQQAVQLSAQIRNHLFASPQVQKIISTQLDSFKRQIAQLRADVRKLLYDE